MSKNNERLLQNVVNEDAEVVNEISQKLEVVYLWIIYKKMILLKILKVGNNIYVKNFKKLCSYMKKKP